MSLTMQEDSLWDVLHAQLRRCTRKPSKLLSEVVLSSCFIATSHGTNTRTEMGMQKQTPTSACQIQWCRVTNHNAAMKELLSVMSETSEAFL